MPAPLHLLAMALLRNMVLLQPLVPQAGLLRALAFAFWLWFGVPAVQARPAVLGGDKSLGFLLAHPVVTTRPIPMPRCCTRIADEFKPSYASVLVFGQDTGALEQAVADLESTQRITSCFTAWCPNCQGPYLLTTDLDAFPAPSAHHTHKLVLLSVLRESGAFGPPEPA